MKGLVIRAPWINLILSGKKTWEMRSRPTSIRGEIALIRAGSGLICGTATLAECLQACTPEQLRATIAYHAIPESGLAAATAKGWTTPWVLRDIRLLEPPVHYKHPFGAVTWVDLGSDVLTGRTMAREVADLDTPQMGTTSGEAADQATHATRSATAPAGQKWVDIRLTEGNLKNGHTSPTDRQNRRT